MNVVMITGRLTKDVEVRYTQSQMAVAKFTLAVKRKKGDTTDFIPIVAFDKTAENCERFLGKGRQVAVQGTLQIDTYEKDGKKQYSTYVCANSVEFLGDKQESKQDTKQEQGFQYVDEEIPF